VRAHRTILWALALFLWSFPLLALPVKKIIVEGNSLSSDRLILKNIRTREGLEYDPFIANEDLKRLIELKKFKDVDMIEKVVEDAIHITIVVVEKPVILTRSFEGLKKVKEADFEDEIRSSISERFDPSTATSDAARIEKVYRDKGYLFAKVTYDISYVENEKDKVDLKFIINENTQVKIADIIFEGNEHLPEKTIRKIMQVKIDRVLRKGVYDAETYALDMNNIQDTYHKLGYLDAKVTPGKSYYSGNQKWLYLTVNIEEGPLYIINDMEIEGCEVISKEEIYKRLPQKVGMPFIKYSRELIQDNIIKYYGEIGRVFTVVSVKSLMDEATSHVKIKVEIQEGEEVFLRNILIEGNDKTRDVVIRRELEFYPLERVNTKLIEESRRNLKNLGFFREDINIEYVPTNEPDQADVYIKVTEKETGSINFALGFSSVEAVFGQIRYNQRNFDYRDRKYGLGGFFSGESYIGDGQNLSVTLNTGTETRRFSIDFSEPWVFNRKIRFGFGLYSTTSSISDDYDEAQNGFYVRLGKEFIRDLEGFVTYGLRDHTIDDVVATAPVAIQIEQGTRLVSSIKNDWVYDKLDNRFFPSEGYHLSPSMTVAGSILGGSQDFYKFEFEAKTYKTIVDFGDNNKHILSGRMKLGYVHEYGDSDRVAIFERFFAGGLGSVRGFDNRSLSPKQNGDEIGGNFLTVANVEYSVPINEEALRAVFFYDMGNAFAETSDFDYSDLRSSVGIGFRLMIPAFGPTPLALDFAKPIRKQDGDDTETFSFNFGSFF
jgi:outer membrane protein insertion porin family